MSDTKRARDKFHAQRMSGHCNEIADEVDRLEKIGTDCAAAERAQREEVVRLRDQYEAAMKLKNIHKSMWLDVEEEIETKWKQLLVAAEVGHNRIGGGTVHQCRDECELCDLIAAFKERQSVDENHS